MADTQLCIKHDDGQSENLGITHISDALRCPSSLGELIYGYAHAPLVELYPPLPFWFSHDFESLYPGLLPYVQLARAATKF